jgi:tripartite-type tricarboxylate transporter receptor subunit TctC
MTFRRRPLLAAPLLAAATLPFARAAAAQEAARLVAAFPPGAALDGIARILAEEAAQAGLGTTVVENRPGANGNIAGAHVARARPDGRTLLFTIDTTLTVNPHLYPDLGYDPAALAPVALAGTYPVALLVHPGSGISTLSQFIAATRSRALFYSSGGNGSPGHLAMEALRAALGIPVERLEHVPQRGNAEAIQELVSGRVQAGFLAVSGGAGLVRDGRLRPLAISGTRRMALLPDVPTIPEAGGPAGFAIRFAYLLMAPRGLDAALAARWAGLVPSAFARETVRGRLAAWAVEPDTGAAAEAAAWIADAHARWGQVVRASGMRLG